MATAAAAAAAAGVVMKIWRLQMAGVAAWIIWWQKWMVGRHGA
jgi:hypothetical protein